jgi:hypothetical protein
MKKIILLIACAAGSIAMVNAQTDTTRSSTSSTSQSQSSQSTQYAQSQYQNYPTKDMKRVNSSEIPASLKTTLQGPEYKGWESGTVYQNSTTGEYYLQSSPSSSTSATGKKSSPTWYHFDKSGKRVPDSPKEK